MDGAVEARVSDHASASVVSRKYLYAAQAVILSAAKNLAAATFAAVTGFSQETPGRSRGTRCRARSFDSARRLASLRMTSSCMQLITRQLFRCADHAAVGERSLNLDDERSVDGRNITIASRAAQGSAPRLPVDKVQPMVCAERLGTADRFIKAARSLHSKILSRRNPHARNRRGQPFR